MYGREEFYKKPSAGERGTWSTLVFSLAANLYFLRIQITMLPETRSMVILL